MPAEEPSASAFVAFPADPPQLGECIERAIRTANDARNELRFRAWPEHDIAGRPLTRPVLGGIKEAPLVVADVTSLNFNVTYEIGFAIGVRKRAYLIRNASLEDDKREFSKVGIFDTLGYVSYEDSRALSNRLLSISDQAPLEVQHPLDRKAPVYLLETPVRGDVMTRITSRVKKARLQYRSFSPSEEPRLAAIDAIKHVSSSHGVVVPLLSESMRDAEIHNIRSAFVAGLAHGMEKPTLILHDHGTEVPLDIRDSSKAYQRVEDIDEHIHEFALDVVQSMQISEQAHSPSAHKLAQVTIGDPMAENEFQTLGQYYLQRDEFGRTCRGEVNMVVGRKGMGKTALFSQVRNFLRRDAAVVVVDLKPEGYQLVKLKEEVLGYLTDGAKSHLLTAFWEYLLLLEVAYKLLEKDRFRQRNDHLIQPHYSGLKNTYDNSPYSARGDFSERLIELSSFLSEEYSDRYGSTPNQRLTSNDVTEILHAGNLRELKTRVSKYLEYKKGTWILFDNLDKGWSVPGPKKDDIFILRCLIDAGRKIQRDMQKRDHDFHCIVFVRNDVYQLLMNESPDFGKEMRVSLDWSDADMLREMLRLRLVQNDYDSESTFEPIWSSLCVSHYKSEETSQYMIDRCLMRPRNLIKIFNHCKGFAVNFRHERIEASDIDKGIESYSNDLLIEADQELASIEDDAAGLIYHLTDEHWKFSREELAMLFEEHNLAEIKYDDVIDFLLYFGFFGIRVFGRDAVYIYDVAYDMKQLRVQVDKHADRFEYVLNPAFWPALRVGPRARR